MSTIMCLDCKHIVLVFDSRGRCSHCGAEYEVEVRKTKDSKLDGVALEARQNVHRG